MQSITLLMGLNVVLGVLAYRELLTFQPRMYSAASGFETDAEQYLFTPNETAPLLVVLMSLWLVHHRRAALFSLPRVGGSLLLGGGVIALGLVVYFWSIYTSAPDLQGLALIANLVGGLIVWRGVAAVRVCLVPLFLLLYAIPLPSPLIATMIWHFQLASAQLAGWMLYVIGIPHVVSSEMIYLPQDTYHVIESCSGFRSIQTLSMFAILMSDLFNRSRLHLICMVVASAPIAFLMNGLRVTTLILNPHSEIHSIHVAQGLVVLMGGLTLLYLFDGLLGRFLSDPAAGRPAASEGEVAAPAFSLATPMQRTLALTTLLVVMLGALYGLPSWRFHGEGGLPLEETIAAATHGWRASEMPPSSADVGKVSFRQSVRQQYTRAATGAGVGAMIRGEELPIELFVGVGDHLDRFKSPFSPKNQVPGRGFVTEDSGVYVGEEKGEGGPQVSWKQLRSGTRRVLSYFWSQGDRGLLAESARTFWALDRSDWARERPVIVVRLSTPVGEDTESNVRQAHARLRQFHARIAGALADLAPAKRSNLPQETARVPDYPLWETFFTQPRDRRVENPIVFGVLSAFRPVAWPLHYLLTAQGFPSGGTPPVRRDSCLV